MIIRVSQCPDGFIKSYNYRRTPSLIKRCYFRMAFGDCFMLFRLTNCKDPVYIDPFANDLDKVAESRYICFIFGWLVFSCVFRFGNYLQSLYRYAPSLIPRVNGGGQVLYAIPFFNAFIDAFTRFSMLRAWFFHGKVYDTSFQINLFFPLLLSKLGVRCPAS